METRRTAIKLMEEFQQTIRKLPVDPGWVHKITLVAVIETDIEKNTVLSAGGELSGSYQIAPSAELVASIALTRLIDVASEVGAAVMIESHYNGEAVTAE